MSSRSTTGRFFLNVMKPRDPHQPERSASTLELFFDLVFVIAVSIAAVNLHHQLGEGHIGHGVLIYLLVFFNIWWTWMNFTWFATAFDTDDWLYRVLTVLQMIGVLVLAAGIGPIFEDGTLTLLIIGYVIMRVAMGLQWFRASRCGGEAGKAALHYGIGIVVVQVLWVLWFFLADGPVQLLLLLVLILAELSVPVISETVGGRTPWHPEHITERYGLFTLILLGESLLASANAIIEGIREHHEIGELVTIAMLTVVSAAALWWIYFWAPHHRSISGFARSIRYGYVHYFVFAAAGAFSAGIEVEIAQITGHTELSDVVASFTVTIPVAIFILGIWWIAMKDHADAIVNSVIPVGAVLVLFDPLIPIPVILTTIILVVMVVVLVIRQPNNLPEGSDKSSGVLIEDSGE